MTKRIEGKMNELVDVLKDPRYQNKALRTEVLMQAVELRNEDVDEQVKARVLPYIMIEFRKNRVVSKHEIEQNELEK